MTSIFCRYFRFSAGLLAAWLFGAVALAGELDAFKQGVVRVISHGKDGIPKTGTGFIVKITPDRAYIVTATHVVQGAERIEIEFFAKREALVPAKVGKMEDDKERGIAYLIVNSAAPVGIQTLSLAPQIKLSEGTDEVLTLGFPQGAPGWSPKSLKFATRDGRELLFDGKVNQGNSGGPLIKDGQVVGLIQSERSGYVRANPASAVLEFLEGSSIGLAAPPANPVAPALAPPPQVGTDPSDTDSASVPTALQPTTATEISIADVTCSAAGRYVSVVSSGRARGPVGTLVMIDFDQRGNFFDSKLDCGAWTRWRHGDACVREQTAPETTNWRNTSQLSATPQMAVALLGQAVDGEEISPIQLAQCRIARCDQAKAVCANQPPAPGIPPPLSQAKPPARDAIAAASPRFSWGKTVKRSGLLLLSTRGEMWLSAVGGAERNPVSNAAELAIVGNKYFISSSLHTHRLPVKIMVATDRLMSGDFMQICESGSKCVAPTLGAGAPEQEFRSNMQVFFLEVAKVAMRRTLSP